MRAAGGGEDGVACAGEGAGAPGELGGEGGVVGGGAGDSPAEARGGGYGGGGAGDEGAGRPDKDRGAGPEGVHRGGVAALAVRASRMAGQCVSAQKRARIAAFTRAH